MKKHEKLKIPMDFSKAVSAFLKVKPEPKKPKKSAKKP